MWRRKRKIKRKHKGKMRESKNYSKVIWRKREKGQKEKEQEKIVTV